MQGQHSIPSDTVCYPAKLVHGHIENLIEKGVHSIFYPCMTYDLDEGRASNCYNCPVVAYYPELLEANVTGLQSLDFMMPYFELVDPKRFQAQAIKFFCKKYPRLKKKDIVRASDAAYRALDAYYAAVREQGRQAIAYADENGLELAGIVGRPYHIDPEINHGLNQMIASYGMVIVSEDAVWNLAEEPEVHVLNQWTYHSRMYSAANYVVHKPNAQLIQLVSFGCGIDAITTDEFARSYNLAARFTPSSKLTRSTTLALPRSVFAVCWPPLRRAKNLQNNNNYVHVPFTVEMKKDYTILVPNMLPIQLGLSAS